MNETKQNGLIPDIVLELKKFDNSKDFLVYELEEANDPIFNKNGKLSGRIFDGINQAMKYLVYRKINESHSYFKGIAIVGSYKKWNDAKNSQFAILRELYPRVEIHTYEDLIEKNKKIIEFFETRISE